ncbi:MAG: hypothetical protein AB7U47_17570, partial [Variibacter sp.]
ATRIGLGHIEGASLLVFGLILVGCVLYLPQGIRGGIVQFLDWRSGRGGASMPVPADTRPR